MGQTGTECQGSKQGDQDVPIREVAWSGAWEPKEGEKDSLR